MPGAMLEEARSISSKRHVAIEARKLRR